MWDFETDPGYQAKLDWAAGFVREEVEPLDHAFPMQAFRPLTPELARIVLPLKEEVKQHGLWATHLKPELGGQGHGQLQLALLNEILGQSHWAPIVFGCQAPDTGNAEIISHYGTDEQKAKYLEPLLNGEVFSCYAMTEPEGGADPTQFKCRAVKDGDHWVIDGYKYFASNASSAAFYIAMIVTSPDAPAHQRMSQFLIPADTPGVVIERNVGLAGDTPDEAMHAILRFENCRVPADALLGGEGQAFAIAQTRLGGGRIHHAMRTIGQCKKALDMMCERAVSRHTQGSRLADKQFVQGDIADSYAELMQFRLYVLYTAWTIDRYDDYKKVRKDIAAIKVLMPKVYQSIAQRALHLHGALGTTNDMPLYRMLLGAEVMAIADGPTEVHKITVAKQVLRDYKPVDGLWPSEYGPHKVAAARAKFGLDA